MKAPLVYRPLPPNTYDRNPEWFEVTPDMIDVLLGSTSAEREAARKPVAAPRKSRAA